jgi:hypothetical protein
MTESIDIYTKAYETAVSLYSSLGEDKKIPDEKLIMLADLSTRMLTSLAGALNSKKQKIKRYCNFKARDFVHQIILDLDFLHDTGQIESAIFEKFSKEYNQISSDIWKENQKILQESKN